MDCIHFSSSVVSENDDYTLYECDECFAKWVEDKSY